MASLMAAGGGESLTSQLVQARVVPVSISPTEQDSISLKGSLVLPSARTTFLSLESSGGDGRVECGEKLPCVPAGLEGASAAGVMCQRKKGLAGSVL